MHRPALPMTPANMANATRRAQAKVQGVLDLARELTTDPRKDERLAKGLCKACFYGPPRIAGAAMTSQPCMCCGADQMYGSTNTDVLCAPCAQENGLCKHCGGDLDMNADRAEWPTAKPTE